MNGSVNPLSSKSGLRQKKVHCCNFLCKLDYKLVQVHYLMAMVAYFTEKM